MSIEVVGRVAEREVDLDLTVDDCETVAVVGPNGAGKSTLLQAVAGLLRLQSGEVRIDGHLVASRTMSMPPHRRRVAYLPQEPSLFPHLDVTANVAFGLTARGQRRTSARARAVEMLEAVGAADLAARRPPTLSGGQAQRVAIARALVTQPTVLLVDEPLSSVDADGRSSLRELIARHAVGRSCVIVSHDEADVAALASRVVRMG